MAAAPPTLNPSNRLCNTHHHPPPIPCVQEETLVEASSDFDTRNLSFTSTKRKQSDVTSDEEESEEGSEIDSEDEVQLEIVPGHSPITEPQKRTSYDMFELFSAIINDDDKDNLEDNLYGNIKIAGGFGYVYLFKREEPEEDITVFENKEGLKELLLTGPTDKSYVVEDPVTVCVNLRNASTGKSYWPGFDFDTLNEYENIIFNTPLSATISGNGFGSITLKYAVFKNAVAAKVEVRLLDQDNDTTTTTNGHRVFGEIYAENVLYGMKSCLFYKKQKKPEEDIIPDVDGKQHIIPLSKTILACPSIGDLRIELDLKDSNTGLSIVKDTVAVFSVPAGLRNFFGNTILGKTDWRKGIPVIQKIGNNVEVTVAWSIYFR